MGETFNDLLRDAIGQTINLAVGVAQAIAVLALAVVVAGALRRWVRGRLTHALIPENGKTLAENGVTLAVYIAAVTVLLAIWGVSWSTLLTAIGVSTIVVALGLQATLQSFVGGVLVLFERPYNVGDRIWYSKDLVDGTVEEIRLRTTVIRSEDGDRILVPNSLILTQAVINHSPDRALRTIVTVKGVDPSARSAADVQATIDEALAEVPGLSSRPQAMIRTRFGRLTRLRRPTRPTWLKGAVHGVARAIVTRTTQVRVTWSGAADPAVREEVVRRLKEVFPDSSFSVRRW
ncbi:MAG TPA: mechanosensitive ion channel domain-containing protein [Thermomicrobiales bacterium]|jgi:small-conductance mechanosensitive channel